MKKENIIQKIKIGILALVLVVGVGYAQAQFQGPSSTPPGGNVDAPVNVGTATQIKDGDLGVTNFTAFGNALVRQTLGVEGGRGVQIRADSLTPDPFFSKYRLAVEGGTIITGLTDQAFYFPVSAGPYTVYDNGWGGPTTSATLTCGSLNQSGIPCLVHAPQFNIDDPAIDPVTHPDAQSPQYPMTPNQIQAIYSMLYSSLLCADHNGEPVLCQELFRDWPYYINPNASHGRWH